MTVRNPKFLPPVSEHEIQSVLQYIPSPWSPINLRVDQFNPPVETQVSQQGMLIVITLREVHFGVEQDILLPPGLHEITYDVEYVVQPPPKPGDITWAVHITQDEDTITLPETTRSGINTRRVEVKGDEAVSIRLGLILQTSEPKFDGFVKFKRLAVTLNVEERGYPPSIVITPGKPATKEWPDGGPLHNPAIPVRKTIIEGEWLDVSAPATELFVNLTIQLPLSKAMKVVEFLGSLEA